MNFSIGSYTLFFMCPPYSKLQHTAWLLLTGKLQRLLTVDSFLRLPKMNGCSCKSEQRTIRGVGQILQRRATFCCQNWPYFSANYGPGGHFLPGPYFAWQVRAQASQLDLVKNLETCYINGSLYSSIVYIALDTSLIGTISVACTLFEALKMCLVGSQSMQVSSFA